MQTMHSESVRMMASLPIPDLEDLTRERELVAEMLRRSRLILLYGEAGCGKTTLLRSVCSQESSDIAVLFDSWHRPLLPRLRDWMHATLCARLGRETVGPPPESSSFTENVRGWRKRLGVRFLVVFDQFEHYLIQSPTDEGVSAFAAEFIRAAGSPVDGVHFLLSLREEDKFRLVRFQRSIPGLYDSWIRLPPRRITPVSPRTLKASASSSIWAFAPRVPQATPADSEAASSLPRTPPNVSAIPPRVREAPPIVEEALPRVAEASPSDAATPPSVPEPDSSEIPPSVAAQSSIAEARLRLPKIDVAALVEQSKLALDSGIQRLIAFAAVIRGLSTPLKASAQRLIVSAALMGRWTKPLDASVRRLIASATSVQQPWKMQLDSRARTVIASAALLAVVLAAWLWLPVGSREPSVTTAEAAPDPTSTVSSQPAAERENELAANRPGETPAADSAQRGANGDRTAASTADPTADSAPLVFILVREDAQRRHAERLKRRLAQKGITVSGIRQIERGPQIADLRYFRQVEASEARRVQRTLDELGVRTQIKRIGGYETTATPRQYELWLGPGGAGS
jgi:hypothetical protein